MNNIKVRLQGNTTTVRVQEADLVNASTSVFNPISVATINAIGDVDASGAQNGSVLVYNAATNKWISTTTLDLQNMEGGEY